jgi:hypothetical protein
LHAVISPAPIGIFENRIEISFPSVSSRFIKVVVSPLSTTFSGVIEIENIFITEMTAFITTSGEEDEKRVDTTHNFSSQLNGKLSDKTSIGYNLLTTLRKEDSDPSSDQVALLNALHVRHIFNRIFSATATLSRDESKITSDSSDVTRRVSHDFASLLSAAYLPTLSQTLSFGISEEESEAGRSNEGSLFLRTSAALYRGWDVFTDVGYSRSESGTGGQTTGISFSAETSVVPNEEISLDVRYSESKNKIEAEETTTTDRAYDVQASYIPFRYISFFVRLLISESSGGDSSELQTYSVSWSPFPDGDLQLFVSHSEALRPSDDKEDRSTGGNVRWNINRYATLIVAYFYSSAKTAVETTDASTFTAELDMTF